MSGFAGNGPRYGRGQRYFFIASGGETGVSGSDITGLTLKIVPGFELLYYNGTLIPRNAYTATVSAISGLPAMVVGDEIEIVSMGAIIGTDAISLSGNGADVLDRDLFRRNILAAPKKNYVLNGAMMVSQENGATAQTVSGSYPVDQFFQVFTHTGAISVAQVASKTTGGSSNRIRLTVVTADVSVSAGDYQYIGQRIEGLRVSDLKLGTSNAKTVTLKFGVKAPAGTYCVVLCNGAFNRSYTAEYVISAGEANTDVVKSVTIALDQLGTWAVDNSAGLEVRWGLMAGATFQQAVGSWGSVNSLGSSNQFNLIGTVGNIFELFDVGLYEGTIAPSFEVPDFGRTLTECQRYWESAFDYGTPPQNGVAASRVGFWNYSASPGNMYVPISFKATKRAAPTMTQYNSAGATNSAQFDNIGIQGGLFYIYPLASQSGSFHHWVANTRL
jgi:hypothetical protein